MSTMNTLRAAALAACIALSQAAPAADAAAGRADALHQSSWQAADEARLRAALPSLDAATDFVRSVLTQPAYTYDYAKVSAFRFVDLEGNGRLSLLCRMNTGGREVNSLLAVITPTRGGYQYDVISSEGFELADLSTVVADLNHDGRKELIVRTLDDAYQGARPMRTFTHVYKVVGGKVYRADAEFGAFYSNTRVPEIQARLRALASAEKGESADEAQFRREEAAVLKAELQSISAQLGR